MAPRVADSEWAMEATPTPVQRAAPKRVPLGFARMGDERLSQLVGSGRERAFAVLYERYHQPLYRYCRSLVRNDADAQDVLQSAFALAFTALRDGKRNAPLRPWLYRIAHNEAISLLRRRRGGEQELSDSVVPPVASAADQADERARMALLVADLEQLPERQRVALLMRELNGLSHADIALVLGTSVGAAKQAIFDARSALLDLAEGRAMECEEVRRKVSERDRRALRGRRLRSHLRDCSHCAAFAAAIPERRSDLQALAPFLPPSAAAALFRRTAKSAAGHGAGTGPGGAASAGIGSGGSGAGGAATAGAAGKVGGAALVSKTIAGAAIVAAAAAGVGGLTKVLPPRAGRGLAVKTHIHHAPRATAGVGRNYVSTAGAGGVGCPWCQLHRCRFGGALRSWRIGGERRRVARPCCRVVGSQPSAVRRRRRGEAAQPGQARAPCTACRMATAPYRAAVAARLTGMAARRTATALDHSAIASRRAVRITRPAPRKHHPRQVDAPRPAVSTPTALSIRPAVRDLRSRIRCLCLLRATRLRIRLPRPQPRSRSRALPPMASGHRPHRDRGRSSS